VSREYTIDLFHFVYVSSVNIVMSINKCGPYSTFSLMVAEHCHLVVTIKASSIASCICCNPLQNMSTFKFNSTVCLVREEIQGHLIVFWQLDISVNKYVVK